MSKNQSLGLIGNYVNIIKIKININNKNITNNLIIKGLYLNDSSNWKFIYIEYLV